MVTSNDESMVAEPTTQVSHYRQEQIRSELRASSAELDQLEERVSELLCEVQDGEYWKAWDYDSFGEFVKTECSFGLRKAQELIRIRKVFIDTHRLSAENLREFEWSKAAIVARVINEENREELLEALGSESLRELRDRAKMINATKTRDGSADDCVEQQTAEIDTTRPLPDPRTDWRLPLPDQSKFYVCEEVWEQICFGAFRGGKVLLVGPSGCGKSEIVYLFAQVACRQLDAFNFGAMSEPRSALIGNTHLEKSKGTWFQKSRFVAAIETPNTCVLLDEISRAGRDAFNIVLPLLDRQGYLALDESKDSAVVHLANNVCFFATANVGMEYTGASDLDQALKDRFSSIIQLGYPPAEQELKVLLSRCTGLDSDNAEMLVQIANSQREQASEGDFMTTISTRSLIEAGNQIAAGISISRAFRYCILNRFPEDGGEVGERSRLHQLVSRFAIDANEL